MLLIEVNMFLNEVPYSKEGRTKLVLQTRYKNEKGKRCTKTIEVFGYTDELEKEYGSNYKEHFKKIVAERDAEEKKKNEERYIEVSLDKYANMAKDYDENGEVRYMKPLGHAYIAKLISVFKLDTFVDSRRKYLKCEYNLTNLMRLYIYRRILEPTSKLKDWENKKQYGDKMNFTISQMYAGLQQLAEWKDSMLIHLNKIMCEEFGRKSGYGFMDGTNVYYEIEDEDGFRMDGVSKENRKLPLTQLGVLIDSEGIPMSYDIYAGNTNDCLMLRPAMKRAREQFGLKHMIYVADKGFYDGKTIADCIINHDGYVISNSVRGTKISQKLRDEVIKEEGFNYFDEKGNKQETFDEATTCYKYKVINEPGLLNVEDEEGNKKKVKGCGKYIIVYWSSKYAIRAKADRQKAIEKAMEKSHTNSKSKIDNSYGSNKYLTTEVYDKDDKKVEDYKAKIKYDQGKIDNDEKLDGYYLIESNLAGIGWFDDKLPFKEGEECRWREDWGMLQLNKELTELGIVDIYSGLWKIEQSFRIMKSDLNLRPVYVSNKKSIEGHFLICFLSLFIVRMIEKFIGKKYTMNALLRALRLFGMNDIGCEVYAVTYYSQILTDLNLSLGLNFNQKLYERKDLKRCFGETRTRDLPEDTKKLCTTITG